jgi:CRP-like cAMP-binding protein
MYSDVGADGAGNATRGAVFREPDPGPVRLEQNHLLAALPAAERARLRRHLQVTPMALGEILYEPGSPMRHAYFPTTAIVSLLNVTSDGSSAEIAIIGNEGLVGVALCMGSVTTVNYAIVQSAGYGARLSGKHLTDEFVRGGPVQHLLLHYTQALFTEIAQTALCNRHHSLEQQLCRWLLLSLDRLPSNELIMTQELIANMLGVRRQGVTEAAHKLQSLGLIHYSRGHIKVLDRRALERQACECYAVVKREFDRLLPLQLSPLADLRGGH